MTPNMIPGTNVDLDDLPDDLIDLTDEQREALAETSFRQLAGLLYEVEVTAKNLAAIAGVDPERLNEIEAEAVEETGARIEAEQAIAEERMDAEEKAARGGDAPGAQ